jgi:hypothetical protein
MAARVEELDQFACLRIKPADIWAFKRVAVVASQSKIVRDGAPTVFFRDDVIDFEWKNGMVGRQLTVLTSVLRSLANK